MKPLCKPIIELVALNNLARVRRTQRRLLISGEDFTDLEGGFFVDVDE